MKADISVIIPIYKGKRYISYWIHKLEKNLVHLKVLQLTCELILVNDFPEETIMAEDFQPCDLSLQVLNCENNQGIHGARMYGLKHAKGKWVVLLDQDDLITDDYLLKQKLCIGDADAVVCNGYMKPFCMDTRRFIYAGHEDQEKVKDLSYYIATGNPICSPGQVMLKRESISAFWGKHILKVNGADDYFLWILMLKEGKKFVLNEEKLYTHVGHGNNTSDDISSMLKSIHEVEQVLVTNHILDDTEQQIILNRKPLGTDRPAYADVITVYDYWLYLENRNQKVINFLQKCGYFKIGIYGMGYIGNRLYDNLSSGNIRILFAIDRQAGKFTCSIPVFCLEDTQIGSYMKRIDAIIITAEAAFESVKEKIVKEYGVPVLSFKNILLEMIEMTEKGV